jgi:hypothetical protein
MSQTATTLSKARKRVISNLAEYTANLYFPNTLILPDTIALDNGISFSYGNYGDCFDGLIEQLSGDFHIYINLQRVKRQDSTRSRFTFGHELGHFFIDEHRLALSAGKTPSHPSTTDFSSKNLVEVEADYFACSLLMPTTRFIADCQGQKVSLSLLQALATKYNVSIPATLLRYANIGNHPIVVVCSQNGNVLWHWKSEDFEFQYLKSTKGKVPVSTVTGEYFFKNKKYNSPEKIYAEDWFDYVEYERNSFALTEQCIYYDNINMVFSVIWIE